VTDVVLLFRKPSFTAHKLLKSRHFSQAHFGPRAILELEARFMHPQPEVTVIRRTGPNTPEGKARSSANALKHGLTSRHVVLPGENRAEFDALVARLIEEHEATTTLEIEIVHEIAGCIWRLDRARKAESEYFYVNFIADKPTKDMERRFALVLRYATAIERELHRAITRLQQLKKQQKQQLPTKEEFVSQNSAAQATSPQLTTSCRPPATSDASASLPPGAQLATGNQPLATTLEHFAPGARI
jgi:hypothetical protein